MKNLSPKSPAKLIASLVLLGFFAVFLMLFRVASSDSTRYIFLIWNLFLAAIPAFFAYWLAERLKTKPWKSPKQIGLTVAWLLFLPNSFYIITDFIHLRENFEADYMYDIVMFTVFVISGLVFGFMSLFMVHTQLVKRLKTNTSHKIIAVILLACSFAIYLGRYSRWNTWDVIFKPAGLLFDVSDRVVNPALHLQTYEVTGLFFAMLGLIYFVIWQSVNYLQK